MGPTVHSNIIDILRSVHGMEWLSWRNRNCEWSPTSFSQRSTSSINSDSKTTRHISAKAASTAPVYAFCRIHCPAADSFAVTLAGELIGCYPCSGNPRVQFYVIPKTAIVIAHSKYKNRDKCTSFQTLKFNFLQILIL